MKSLPKPEEMTCLLTMAKAAHQSGFYKNIGNQDAILAIMLLAREYDLPPMQALTGGIWNIQGKVEISARFINMMIRAAGHKIKIEESTEKGCKITGERHDTKETYTASFLEEDAKKAQVLNKQPWLKHPKDMYFARAISILGRRLFPDVIGNAYVEDEIKDEIEQPQPGPKLTPAQPPIDATPSLEREDVVKALGDHYNCDYALAREFILEWERKAREKRPDASDDEIISFYPKLHDNPDWARSQFDSYRQNALKELQKELEEF